MKLLCEFLKMLLFVSTLILVCIIAVFGTRELLKTVFGDIKINKKTNYECISGYLYEHKKDFNGKGIKVQVIKNNNIMRCKDDK
jgi:hypothetical protein